jgi:tetratricopeptide (TPR) repeat protein
MRGVTVVFALMMGASSLAHAQDKRAQAVQLADESEKAYKAGQFEKAAELLRKAHATFPEPLLLYNLGRALEGMGDTKAAVEAYEQYLNDAKHIDDRPAIERRIATLKAQLDKQREDAAQHEKERQEKERLEKQRIVDEQQAKDQAAKDQAEKDQAEKDRLAKEQAEKDRLAKEQQAQQPLPPQTLPVVEDDRSTLEQFGPWATIGVGGALVLTGAVFGIQASNDHDEAVKEPMQAKAAELQSAAQTDATIANVMFVVGGAAVVGGAVWELIEWRAGRREPTTGAHLKIGPNRVAVEWVWR